MPGFSTSRTCSARPLAPSKSLAHSVAYKFTRTSTPSLNHTESHIQLIICLVIRNSMCAQQHLATAAETANIQSHAFARARTIACQPSRLPVPRPARPLRLLPLRNQPVRDAETGVKAKEERTRKENGADDCFSQGVLADIEAAVRMEKGCCASSCICPPAPDSIAYSRARSSRHASALTRSLPEKQRLRVEYHPDPCSY